MNRKASLTKLVKVGNKWTNRKPVYTKKSGLLTSRVWHNGKETDLGGVFVLRWYENGVRKRKRLTASTAEAMGALNKLLATLEARSEGVAVVEDSGSGKRQLKKAVEEFLEEYHVNKARKTWLAFKQVLGTFLSVCKRTYVEDITRRDVMVSFVGALQEQGLSDRTQFHRFACLVSFLKANGSKVVKLKDAPKFTEAHIEVYTEQELKAFYAACDEDDLFLGHFLLYTGGREQEIEYAEFSDISSDKRTFHIQAKPKYRFKPKDYEERRIPIPGVLIEELKKYKSKRGQQQHLIFPANNGRPDGHLIRRIKNVAFRAGLNCGRCVGKTGLKCANGPYCERWFLHKFRHTYATMHLRAGVDVRTVQMWLGHSSLETTQKYLDYLRAESHVAKTAVDATFAGI